MQDSPLLNLEQPILFLMGSNDEFCSPADLSETVARMASSDVRVEIFEVSMHDLIPYGLSYQVSFIHILFSQQGCQGMFCL